MAEKRRDFHDLSDDGDESDSPSVHEDSRFAAFSNKRQRLSPDEDKDISSGSDAEEVQDHESEAEDDISISKSAPAKKSKIQPLTPEQLEKARRKVRKSGVIYISRVPPFMKPRTLRNLLTPYGKIGRMFLTPESTPAYTHRVKSGGNRKRSFLDGWVEFSSKRKAKACVELLNRNIIGGKKGSFYHDDLWNMKYLKGFKWSDIMEQSQGEERIREGKLGAELIQEARERKQFQRNLERAKRERTTEAKRLKKGQASMPEDTRSKELNEVVTEDNTHRKARFERPFTQEANKGSEISQGASGTHIERLRNGLF